MNETQGFLYLGNSNWTICSLLSWFCFEIFLPSWSLYWELPFPISYYPRERKMRKKEINPIVVETPEFLYLGNSNWTICSLLSWFCFEIFLPSWSLYWELPFPISYYPRERKMRKRDSPKSGWDTGVSVLGEFKLDLLQPVKLILLQDFPNFLIFILGLPFLITPERGKWEKGNHPSIDGTQGFQCLGHSNWTICSLSSKLFFKMFPTSWSLY